MQFCSLNWSSAAGGENPGHAARFGAAARFDERRAEGAVELLIHDDRSRDDYLSTKDIMTAGVQWLDEKLEPTG